MQSLSLDINFVAISYFLEHYMGNTALSYLTPRWSHVGDEQIVTLAVRPIAIAAFSNSVKQPQLLDQARTQYSIALSATNEALSKPQSATRNSTLLSVLLLAMYEALTFRGRKSPQNWIMHVNGLATILELREHGPDHGELGELLARHASNQILSNCAQRSIPIPRQVRGLRQRVSRMIGPPARPDDIGELLQQLAMISLNIASTSATNTIIECLRLDCLVESAMQRLRVVSPYTVLSKEESFGQLCIEGGQVHRYPSQNAVRQWNNMRSLRLVLNQWISHFASGKHTKATPLQTLQDPLHIIWDQLPRNAIVSFKKTLDDVLASIPYSRGFLGDPSTACPRFLVWPLSRGASSELCPPHMKTFIIETLLDIGTRHDIEQVREAGIMLQEGVSIEDWYVIEDTDLLLTYTDSRVFAGRISISSPERYSLHRITKIHFSGGERRN